MDYSIGGTEAHDTKSSFNIIQTAALIAGIDPGLIKPTVNGEYKLIREWDCRCDVKGPLRTMTFRHEEPLLGNDTQYKNYAEANAKFHRWIDAIYEAVESFELPAALVYKINPKEPVYVSMPRYAQTDAPDAERTKITRNAIVEWLTSKSITKGYFSPKSTPATAETIGTMPPYLDPNNDCSAYIPALIKAWEHVYSLRLETGVAKAMFDWLTEENKAGRLLNEKDKPLSNQAKEAICLVANWNKKGGAPKTPGN